MNRPGKSLQPPKLGGCIQTAKNESTTGMSLLKCMGLAASPFQWSNGPCLEVSGSLPAGEGSWLSLAALSADSKLIANT